MEEKKDKKALVLAIIGVLVLVVTVVGAAFAYYSVSGSTTSSTAAIGATTGTVGTVNLVQGVNNMYLNLTADQLSYANRYNTYYSTTTNTQASTQVPVNENYNNCLSGYWEDIEGNGEEEFVCFEYESHYPIFATITSSGGDDNIYYKCGLSISIETKNNGGSDASFNALKSSYDVRSNIILSYGSTSNTAYLSGNYLKETVSKKVINTTIILIGNTSKTIEGYLEWRNYNNQNNLSNLNINTEVKAYGLNCGILPTPKDYTTGYFASSQNATRTTNYHSAMNEYGYTFRSDTIDGPLTSVCAELYDANYNNSYLICSSNTDNDVESQCARSGVSYYGSSCGSETESACSSNSAYCGRDDGCTAISCSIDASGNASCSETSNPEC